MNYKNEINELRKKADLLEFIDKLKALGNKKDLTLKVFHSLTTSPAGMAVSLGSGDNLSKLNIGDYMDEFRQLLITFFETKLLPPQEKATPKPEVDPNPTPAIEEDEDTTLSLRYRED